MSMTLIALFDGGDQPFCLVDEAEMQFSPDGRTADWNAAVWERNGTWRAADIGSGQPVRNPPKRHPRFDRA